MPDLPDIYDYQILHAWYVKAEKAKKAGTMPSRSPEVIAAYWKVMDEKKELGTPGSLKDFCEAKLKQGEQGELL